MQILHCLMSLNNGITSGRIFNTFDNCFLQHYMPAVKCVEYSHAMLYKPIKKIYLCKKKKSPVSELP